MTSVKTLSSKLEIDVDNNNDDDDDDDDEDDDEDISNVSLPVEAFERLVGLFVGGSPLGVEPILSRRLFSAAKATSFNWNVKPLCTVIIQFCILHVDAII